MKNHFTLHVHTCTCTCISTALTSRSARAARRRSLRCWRSVSPPRRSARAVRPAARPWPAAPPEGQPPVTSARARSDRCASAARSVCRSCGADASALRGAKQ